MLRAGLPLPAMPNEYSGRAGPSPASLAGAAVSPLMAAGGTSRIRWKPPLGHAAQLQPQGEFFTDVCERSIRVGIENSSYGRQPPAQIGARGRRDVEIDIAGNLSAAAEPALHGQECQAGRPCKASSDREAAADRRQHATAIPGSNAASNGARVPAPPR